MGNDTKQSKDKLRKWTVARAISGPRRLLPVTLMAMASFYLCKLRIFILSNQPSFDVLFEFLNLHNNLLLSHTLQDQET